MLSLSLSLSRIGTVSELIVRDATYGRAGQREKGMHAKELSLSLKEISISSLLCERRGGERGGWFLYFVLSPTMTGRQAGILGRPAFPSAGVQCHLEGG